MSASNPPATPGLDKYSAPQWLGRVRTDASTSSPSLPFGFQPRLRVLLPLSKRTLPAGPGRQMPDDVLERFVKDYIDSVTGDEVVFSWQGGEPTLLGLGFFEKVVALQKKHARAGQRIENDLQTNGTLLDDDWARFLKNGSWSA